MPVTVGQLIDRARSRHWSFSEGNDGGAVAFLNERQRAILLRVIRTSEVTIGTTEEILVADVGATVVAVDSFGAPFFADTTADGYVIRFAGGVPYVDTSEPFVVDPFGGDGDVPGMPLPDDLLRLVWIVAMTSESPVVPRRIEVLNQESAYKAPSMLGLRAFISANRLVPVRTATNDLWSIVQSIRVGCVLCPELTALSDVITLPTPLIHALTAALAEWFAIGSRSCPEPDKTRFEKQRAEADDLLDGTVNSMDAVTSSTVIYKR